MRGDDTNRRTRHTSPADTGARGTRCEGDHRRTRRTSPGTHGGFEGRDTGRARRPPPEDPYLMSGGLQGRRPRRGVEFEEEDILGRPGKTPMLILSVLDSKLTGQKPTVVIAAITRDVNSVSQRAIILLDDQLNVVP